MVSILEELYFENLCSSDRYIRKDPDYAEAAGLCCKNMDNLLSKLNEDERKILERLTDAQADLAIIENKRTFTYGFKLAALILAEVFLTSDELVG